MIIRPAILRLLSLSAILGVATAQPTGEELYSLYCIACHGPDGKGAAGAPFPPLAGSDWVAGDPERMIAVVLHGLDGPIFVSRKPYNLAMPPQGAVLSDEQIALISTYVRASWGNKGTPVTPAMVAAARVTTNDRTSSWTAPDIMASYPLPPSRWSVRELSAKVYKGQWDRMPDFSKLTPISEEKESGLISIRHAGEHTEDFAIVWEGKIEHPGDFDNNFWLSSVGGSRLLVNDQVIMELKGQSDEFRHTSARSKGARGWMKFRLEYFQRGGKGGIMLSRSGGTMGENQLTDAARDATANQYPDILLKPENGKSILYRNTIKGVSPRTIAVGLPTGINYAFSASTFAVETIWTGDFINAGQHWTVRGTGATAPAGDHIVPLARGPAIARLSAPEDPWPKSFQPELKARFLGYDLGEARRPTFRYAVGGIQFEDTLLGTAGSPPTLRRSLLVTIPEGADTDGLALRLATDQGESGSENEQFSLGDLEDLTVAGPTIAAPAGGNLLLPLDLAPGQYRFTITYLWKSK